MNTVALGDNENPEELSGSNGEEILSPTPPSSVPPTVRRRGMPPELRNGQRQMSEAFETFQSALERSSEEDEYELFGKLIAKKVRKLPEGQREKFMLEVHNMYVNRFSDGNNSFSAFHSQTGSSHSHHESNKVSPQSAALLRSPHNSDSLLHTEIPRVSGLVYVPDDNVSQTYSINALN